MEDIWNYFGQWWAVAVWMIMFGIFLAFIPFYKKSQIKPSGAFMSFVVALAFEMFGIPLSLYALKSPSRALAVVKARPLFLPPTSWNR